MSVAASSPAWLTRRALSRNSLCLCVRAICGLLLAFPLAVYVLRVLSEEAEAEAVEAYLYCGRRDESRGATKLRYSRQVMAARLREGAHLRNAGKMSIVEPWEFEAQLVTGA
jgi:hypothetical protein